MKRAIVQPADMSGAPLDELKQWLGISRDAENSLLIGLLQTSLEFCEAFTGLIPLEMTCEETLPAGRQWTKLSAGPVRAITAVELVGPDNARSTLPISGYELEIDSDATGSVRLKTATSSDLVVAVYVAGLAADWIVLPAALRHGIIRLAAHHYLARDKSDDDSPPAAVTALWRPWKKVQL